MYNDDDNDNHEIVSRHYGDNHDHCTPQLDSLIKCLIFFVLFLQIYILAKINKSIKSSMTTMTNYDYNDNSDNCSEIDIRHLATPAGPSRRSVISFLVKTLW